MFEQFRERSLELEHLDKGDYTAEEYEGCIIELQRVNRWLGDTRALRHSLLRTIEKLNLTKFSLIDVGAGSGELLQAVAEWSRERGYKTTLIGVELNSRSAGAIAERRSEFPEINAVRGDAFSLPFADKQFDFAMCSLFTHHFRNEDVVKILRELRRVSSRGIFIIDLHRHPVAYFFYTTIGRLFLHNRLIREDGALSIRRSFKPEELSRALNSGMIDPMQAQPDPVRELFFDATHVGEAREPKFVGRGASFACGAVVRVSLHLDDAQRIVEAKFKAAGCSVLVASISFLIDQVVGKTTAEAAAICQSPPQLRGLPEEKIECTRLACEALIEAIRNYSDAARDEWEGDEALICTCFCVSERTIEREIQTRKLHTIAEVTAACSAGGGCRSCYPLIEEILSAVNS